ncbi:MAG: hypothetical protein AAB539_00055 [Patescibacteria group bacterium]
MVEKFKIILKYMQQEKGDVTMLALLKMDELTDKWTIILSASWATEGDADIFRYVLEKVRSELSPDDLATVARVAIFSQTHHLIQSLRRYATGARIEEEKINGNQIHEGVIIYSSSINATKK